MFRIENFKSAIAHVLVISNDARLGNEVEDGQWKRLQQRRSADSYRQGAGGHEGQIRRVAVPQPRATIGALLQPMAVRFRFLSKHPAI